MSNDVNWHALFKYNLSRIKEENEKKTDIEKLNLTEVEKLGEYIKIFGNKFKIALNIAILKNRKFNKKEI